MKIPIKNIFKKNQPHGKPNRFFSEGKLFNPLYSDSASFYPCSAKKIWYLTY
jgi:hypothetical protein